MIQEISTPNQSMQRKKNMKLLKIVFVIVVLFVNLLIAQPSWADSNYRKNPDYIEITKILNKLQKNAEDTKSEDVQRKIGELQFQKAAIKSGIAWGQCRNETGGNLAIYGNGSEESDDSNSNQIYFLAHGQTTPDQWDCQGVYIPNGVKVAGLDKTGAAAIKIMDGTQLIVKKNPENSELILNLPRAKVVNSSETDWSIPNISQAFVDSRIPSTFSQGDNG